MHVPAPTQIHVNKPAPVHPQPVTPVHGFVLPHDAGAQPVMHEVQKPTAPSVSQPAVVKPPPKNYKQAPLSGNIHAGPYWLHFHGPVIGNPHRWHRWGWNHGIAWYPAPIYWGGGFWGPYGLGSLGLLTPYGFYLYDQYETYYPSYQVELQSPGEQVLSNYGLQQTACDQPNLVVIWGPLNSVVCAYPNALVQAGNYEVNPATLTLISTNSE